jgi:hypothetical protein
MHIPDTELKLFAQSQLPSERAQQIREHLRECLDCFTRLEAMATGGESAQTKEEAVETLTEVIAQVYILGPARFRTRGRILERSPGILKLLLLQELVPGTLVQIRTPDEILLGEVHHCRRISGQRFELALRVQAITKLLPGWE